MIGFRGRRVAVYRRGFPAWVIVGNFALVALIGLDMAMMGPDQGSKAFGVGLAIICGSFAYVMWRTANIVLYSRGALVGTGITPRWIGWDQVEQISLVRDRSFAGSVGHVPVIRLKSGRSQKLGFFFASDGVARDIAADVTRALEAQRQSMEPSNISRD